MKILAGLLTILSVVLLLVASSYHRDAQNAWKIILEAERPTHEVVLSGATLNQIWFPNTWQWLNLDTKYRVQVANSRLLKITGIAE